MHVYHITCSNDYLLQVYTLSRALFLTG